MKSKTVDFTLHSLPFIIIRGDQKQAHAKKFCPPLSKFRFGELWPPNPQSRKKSGQQRF